MKKIVAILIAMMMVISVTVALASGTATTKEKQSEKVPVIIMFKDKTDKDLIKQHGGELKCVYQLKPAVAVSLPQKAIDALEKNPKIAFIVPDLEIFTMAETLEWGVDRIDADIVHEYNKGTGVNVAIMDTGIDYNHPDLAANYKGGYDFGGRFVWQGRNDDDPMDKQGHGTHCAGIVAAVKGNGIGVIGVAPEAYLYAVKVFDDRGNGRYSDVIEGLEWCINNNNIQVISMSFGSAYTAGDPGIEPWINATYVAGILLVGAAGNEDSGEDTVIYPARYAKVIAVAATDISDNRASFSSTGPDVELAAPGDSIYSTYLGGGYDTLSGTSMACPHVSGTAALVIASESLSNDEVRLRLQQTADDLGATSQYGHGLVDADEAAPPTGNQPPVADANGPYTGIEGDEILFNGSGSYDPDGTIMSYDWDFGDGETEIGVTTTHAYSTAGTYTVNLTVTDDEGATGTDTAMVTVTETPNKPPVADANGPYTGIEGDEILFNGSGSYDPDGTIMSYDWDFGDGETEIGVTTTHAYSTAGTYTVNLTVTDDEGATGTDTAMVTVTETPNKPPVADANGPYTGIEGDEILFNGSGSYDPDGTIMSYDWDFGDGETEIGVTTTHAYSTAGTYTVNLTVTDDEGATGTDTAMVTVTETPNKPPVADANGPYTGIEGDEILFNGSGSYDPDGTIMSYDWDFGDGETEIGVTTTHTYSTAGTYTVNLTVTDDEGATGTDTAMVTVTETPNKPPVADANGPYTGIEGDEILFNGSGSYDPDGTIVSYDWDFGDGETEIGVTTTHAYLTAGTYTVNLTVTDNEDATGTDTALITVTEAPANTMHVASIVISTTKYKAKGWFTYATATVKIVDANGEPVENANVSGTWSRLTDDSDSGLTDSNGVVALKSDSVKSARGTFTFTVDGVAKNDWTYKSSANEETSDSITV